MINPDISIIVRTYNNGRFIKKCIESALRQDFNNYEVVVVNDGSTDDTREILDSFEDEKLKVINQENKGNIESAYVGLSHAAGKYVVFLDGDDEFHGRTTLLDLHNSLQTNPDAKFSYCDYQEIDLRNGNGKIVSCSNIFNTLACGILFEKSLFDEIPFWDPDLVFPESDMLIRIMKKYQGIHVPKPLYTYNRHPGAFTADKELVEKGKKQLFDRHGFIQGFKEY